MASNTYTFDGVTIVHETSGNAHRINVGGVVGALAPMSRPAVSQDGRYTGVTNNGVLSGVNVAPVEAIYPEADLKVSTKGDVLGFGTAPMRIPIGSNDQVLTADSGEAAGVKWAAAGGGGLAVQQVEHTTGSIAALGDETVNLALLSDNALIVGVSIERTAGTAGTVLVQSYPNDTFSGAPTAVFGEPSGTGVTCDPGPIFGPSVVNMGLGAPVAQPYHDADGTSEFHVKITNEDAGEPGTFKLKVKYLDLGAY